MSRQHTHTAHTRTIRFNKSNARGLVSAGKYDSRSLGLTFALDMMAFRAAGWVTNDSSSSGGRPRTETIVSSWWCGLWPWVGEEEEEEVCTKLKQ